ncbi:hypothetical protein MNBD_NITROSPINAE01-1533 [hydrothermal vent metagenome]|uniref:Porin domain-containing protein n=1 Tax=hydrothermal vent metagenome TaxID=652676 RepID=A0A3B1BQU0_9ZZZZ
MFGLSGEQKNVTGPVGGSSGDRDTDKVVYGVDLSGNFDETLFWYAQGLWNQWDGFIDENKTYEWFGGFAGVDYIATDKTVSYYFMTNVKGLIEGNVDFLQKDDDADFVGHETQEGYLLVGIDAAF